MFLFRDKPDIHQEDAEGTILISNMMSCETKDMQILQVSKSNSDINIYRDIDIVIYWNKNIVL